MFEEIIPLVTIISLFVILPGMAMYFSDRKRRWEAEHSRRTTPDPELSLIAERMERRIEALEHILDAESPGWRKKYHEHP